MIRIFNIFIPIIQPPAPAPVSCRAAATAPIHVHRFHSSSRALFHQQHLDSTTDMVLHEGDAVTRNTTEAFDVAVSGLPGKRPRCEMERGTEDVNHQTACRSIADCICELPHTVVSTFRNFPRSYVHLIEIEINYIVKHNMFCKICIDKMAAGRLHLFIYMGSIDFFQ